ncbi:phosphoribosyl-ATP diphosphatase [Polynucleobacter kasalickyi]|uniref:Phosphoribosyl-ATP pyrophosphatase n=1 Tax=Polynucleobacter kasalickyi TaxID=1938817 RepID=A0A1W2BZQ7_9BURK|nr:phosphoribosyl-ATP diphosphatase [Polynucleobacter kasalickyi]SMC78132.1 phosphoribosyl-ATP pyrophosphatase [Polynucleobacter kasalickyi]
MSNQLNQILEVLDATIASRRASVQEGNVDALSYVAKLMKKGDDAILKKIGEEATEVVMAAKDSRTNVIEGRFNSEYQAKLVGEVADLWFHSLVLLGQFDLTSKDVLGELGRREGMSGIVEKESRVKE